MPDDSRGAIFTIRPHHLGGHPIESLTRTLQTGRVVDDVTGPPHDQSDGSYVVATIGPMSTHQLRRALQEHNWTVDAVRPWGSPAERSSFTSNSTVSPARAASAPSPATADLPTTPGRIR